MSEQLMIWLGASASVATILGTVLAFRIRKRPQRPLVAIMRSRDGSPDRTVSLLFADGTRSDRSDSVGRIQVAGQFAHTTADVIHAVSGRRIRSLTLVPDDGSRTIEIITDDEQ